MKIGSRLVRHDLDVLPPLIAPDQTNLPRLASWRIMPEHIYFVFAIRPLSQLSAPLGSLCPTVVKSRQDVKNKVAWIPIKYF